MERPVARIIDQQHVESEKEVTGWEAEQILRNYGHQPEQFSTRPIEHVNQQPLTFEEMILQEENKRKSEEDRRISKLNGPKPTTFDGRNGYESEIKYGTDEDSGFGFKIEITTDMKIPKY